MNDVSIAKPVACGACGGEAQVTAGVQQAGHSNARVVCQNPSACCVVGPMRRGGDLREAKAAAILAWNAMWAPRAAGEATKRMMGVLDEAVKFVGDHRKVWIVTKDGGDVEKTWMLAGVIKAAGRELNGPPSAPT